MDYLPHFWKCHRTHRSRKIEENKVGWLGGPKRPKIGAKVTIIVCTRKNPAHWVIVINLHTKCLTKWDNDIIGAKK